MGAHLAERAARGAAHAAGELSAQRGERQAARVEPPHLRRPLHDTGVEVDDDGGGGRRAELGEQRQSTPMRYGVEQSWSSVRASS